MPSLEKIARQSGIKRRRLGQSLIETLTGFMLLIPLALLSYDLTFILIANQNNERLAENAARAAANRGSVLTAEKAVEQVLDDFNQNNATNRVSLIDFNYNLDTGEITLTTQMQVTLPVPIASLRQTSISAQSIVPIVALPAPM